ncbi:Hypothetical predicted protein [Mytilus galloprovincialis]|uniref:Uncharacterized protein n=1 Tax=Mytilus galloprovincialis TaxID=29158 RepID=A0A8B6CJV6_MYTGA|nr:Hypothetical predicted protein [Mytilus galloprovincialis]
MDCLNAELRLEFVASLPWELRRIVRRNHREHMAYLKRPMNKEFKSIIALKPSAFNMDEFIIQPSFFKRFIRARYEKKWQQHEIVLLSRIFQSYVETFRSPSEVGNINIKPSIIVGWIITSKVISDIEENSYITALVEFGTSIISEFSYCRQHPDYKEHMVIQLLTIFSAMFRFMSIHRRWGPVDFRMERIVDKLAMKEELADIIKFSINNDWDLQGHDTNLKPSKIKKNVNHLATGLPDHHYQL